MKKSDITSKLFGLKQKEMADLLGVKRAQLSMYESGQRDLPAASQALLNDMRVHVETSKAKKLSPATDKMKDKMQQHFTKLLRENQFQQMGLERKMPMIQAQLDADKGRMHLANFLAGNKIENEHVGVIHRLVLSKIERTVEKNVLGVLAEMEIKLEVLRFEEKLLQSKLKNDKESFDGQIKQS